ncbi:hypothetical protein MP228_004284 [Amoeboaphelidium protococcarum]|nr:hypothetical protein MP228_004284 [Amoeboaphelidium protococcarum]
MMKDYYDILGVHKTATSEEIKKAYKELALYYHPDKNVGNGEDTRALFQLVSEAYEVLRDRELRSRYDMYGHEGIRQTNNSAGGNPSQQSSSQFQPPQFNPASGNFSAFQMPPFNQQRPPSMFTTSGSSGFGLNFNQFDRIFDHAFGPSRFMDPEELFRQEFAQHHDILHQSMVNQVPMFNNTFAASSGFFNPQFMQGFGDHGQLNRLQFQAAASGTRNGTQTQSYSSSSQVQTHTKTVNGQLQYSEKTVIDPNRVKTVEKTYADGRFERKVFQNGNLIESSSQQQRQQIQDGGSQASSTANSASSSSTSIPIKRMDINRQ